MSIDVYRSFHIISGMNGFASLRLCAFALILMTVTHVAQAHPGHGLAEYGLGHAVSSPFHLVSLLGTGIACWGVAGLVRRTVLRRLLQGGAFVSLLAALLAL